MSEAREEPAVTESEAPGPRRLHLAALVLVLIVGGLLRLHHLAAPSLTVDEISTVAIVTGHVFRDIPQRGAFEAGQLAGRCSGPAASLPAVVSNVLFEWPEELTPPFYYCLLTPWCRVAGTDAFAVRLFSAGVGTLSILLIYLIGSRLFGRWSGLAAAALMATAPMQVQFAQMARCYALVVLCALAGAWWTLRGSLPGYVVATLTGGLCHGSYGPAWLQQAIAFPVLDAKRRVRFAWASLASVAAVGAVALLMAAVPLDKAEQAEGLRGMGHSLLSRMSHAPAEMGSGSMQSLLNVLRIGPRDWDPVALPCMAVLALIGMVWLHRQGTREAKVLMGAAAVPLLLFVALDATDLTRLGSFPRSVLVLTPFVYLLVGAPRRLAPAIVGIALVLPVALPGAYLHDEGDGLRIAAQAVVTNLSPQDQVVLGCTTSQIVGICRYLPPSTPVTLNCPRQGDGRGRKPRKRWKEVAKAMAGHRVWVVLGAPFSQENYDPCTQALEPTHRLGLNRGHGPMLVLLFEPRADGSPR